MNDNFKSNNFLINQEWSKNSTNSKNLQFNCSSLCKINQENIENLPLKSVECLNKCANKIEEIDIEVLKVIKSTKFEV